MCMIKKQSTKNTSTGFLAKSKAAHYTLKTLDA